MIPQLVIAVHYYNIPGTYVFNTFIRHIMTCESLVTWELRADKTMISGFWVVKDSTGAASMPWDMYLLLTKIQEQIKQNALQFSKTCILAAHFHAYICSHTWMSVRKLLAVIHDKMFVAIGLSLLCSKNLLIMCFSISLIFCLLCLFLCFLAMHYADNWYL